MTALSVSTRWDDRRAIISISGDLDLATVHDLREHARAQLTAPNCAELVLDMSALSFLDSSGLGVLVQLRALARDNEVVFTLANVPPGPTRIIEIAGLTDSFGLSSNGFGSV